MIDKVNVEKRWEKSENLPSFHLRRLPDLLMTRFVSLCLVAHVTYFNQEEWGSLAIAVIQDLLLIEHEAVRRSVDLKEWRSDTYRMEGGKPSNFE